MLQPSVIGCRDVKPRSHSIVALALSADVMHSGSRALRIAHFGITSLIFRYFQFQRVLMIGKLKVRLPFSPLQNPNARKLPRQYRH